MFIQRIIILIIMHFLNLSLKYYSYFKSEYIVNICYNPNIFLNIYFQLMRGMEQVTSKLA